MKIAALPCPFSNICPQPIKPKITHSAEHEMLVKTPQLQTLNPVWNEKLIAGDPVKVPRASISETG